MQSTPTVLTLLLTALLTLVLSLPPQAVNVIVSKITVANLSEFLMCTIVLSLMYVHNY